MPGLIYYDEIKQAIFPAMTTEERKKLRLSRVVKELIKRKLPFEYGENGVFTTVDAWNKRLQGEQHDIAEDFEFDR